MGPFPLYVGFTSRAKDFSKEMRRLEVQDPPTLVNEGADATTHTLYRPGHYNTCIITIDRTQTRGKTPEQIFAMLAHESVHAMQKLREAVREQGELGNEVEAYTVQYIAQFCMAMYKLGY